MHLYEEALQIPATQGHHGLLAHVSAAVDGYMRKEGAIPIRLVITASDDVSYQCEIGAIGGDLPIGCEHPQSIFRFARRRLSRSDRFNVAHLVPTGIGAEVGGHAGDAAPTAKLLASVCDTLVTHPNVLNASDIIEVPENTLYVEGSIICQLLMGTVGLQPTRANRLLVLMDKHETPLFNNAVVNSVSGARAAYGLRAEVTTLDPPMHMAWREAASGRAGGRVEELGSLVGALTQHAGNFDAVAITSIIDVPPSAHDDYFRLEGAMVNPWGGVEALLTHATSLLYGLPTAHSPMFESEALANADPGVVDPRMAAEAVSLTFLQCILMGLQRSPQIVRDEDLMQREGVLTVEDISCLVIPDGCIGLPTLAALEQGIPVVAVRENRNVMRNDLAVLPWRQDQLIVVENYWEAAGVVAALRGGLAPEVVRRPLRRTTLNTAPMSGDGELTQTATAETSQEDDQVRRVPTSSSADPAH